MKCPYCGTTESSVLESRISEDEQSIRRRRECERCAKRFTTYERVEGLDLIIIKKDGRRENFDREKLRRGLIKACEKRPVSYEQINDVMDRLEADLRKLKSKEIPSKLLGEKVMNEKN